MVYLLLGSNLGDRLTTIKQALIAISIEIGKITRTSYIYESEPWGVSDQPTFYNQLAEVETILSPLELLENLKKIERTLGRKDNGKWRERLIDIDIIYYHNQSVSTPKLTIPHAEIQNRRFTLVPLCELIPEFIHPLLQLKNKDLLTQCADPLQVTIVK